MISKYRIKYKEYLKDNLFTEWSKISSDMTQKLG